MEKLREKLATLRAEIDAANERADTAEQALKQLEDQQTDRDQELISYQNRIRRLEDEAQMREDQLDEAKQFQRDNEATLNESDVLVKKVTTLEERFDDTESKLREALEKIRAYDLENEGLQRTITQYEKDKEIAEQKYEEMNEKYLASKSELDETIKMLESM
ncbi:tropomyosin-2 [Coemansia sp. RSA 1822]|nr:tropomyosin-2 [Coemansia sp. RSA 638]KAJ2125932.1 tropomyosin-2 [Coemansia sp. RSA 720]KAJ2479403.1 tropomyosin-2 [Coemansia sp. RSA 2131]KAJ2545901.1 tropomyosin-2 [Coemansia sp. RSA 1853]KAJ2567719.1 tropomyosin-2 [Coemansia sp. RSA 1822]KAJ2667050.1 tropomyosin-2 [Coemansia sp. RSA 1199]